MSMCKVYQESEWWSKCFDCPFPLREHQTKAHPGHANTKPQNNHVSESFVKGCNRRTVKQQ